MKSPNRFVRRRRHAGFTLIEVMLVLLILVILGSLAVVAYSRVQYNANIRAAKSQIGLFKTPLEAYHLDLNMYPTSEQGLNALLSPPSNLPMPEKWAGPYLDGTQIPFDPWGREYQYISPSQHSNNPDSYDVWSMGPDGNTEIGNWQ
ncbi:MAG: type II secretion system major pseudopilin GspG [Pirellulales bacterium]|nr:type II secretion system major pseudopilin GspG [Pirellulales bacterium]